MSWSIQRWGDLLGGGGGEDLIVFVFKNGDRYFSIVFLGNIPATPLSSPQKKENKQKNNRFERS